MPSRRQFLAASGSTLAATVSAAAPEGEAPLLAFGLMADCQYADVDPAGQRFYRLSVEKLAAAVTRFNEEEVSFALHLGDWIDRDLASFDRLAPVAARLRAPLHHALGNHDFDVADEQKAGIPGKLGLTRTYYRLLRAGFRFLILDTTEISPYRHPKDDSRTRAARKELAELDGKPYAQPWNGRPSQEQFEWVKREIAEAEKAGESILVFGHHPIRPAGSHTIWNPNAWHELLVAHRCVKAYVHGHNHAGGYDGSTGLHYLTLDGMLDTRENAHGVARLFADRLELTGFGRQASHRLVFR